MRFVLSWCVFVVVPFFSLFSGSDSDNSTERKARAAFSNPLFARHHPPRGPGGLNAGFGSTDATGAGYSASPDRMWSEDIATALAKATASMSRPHESYADNSDDNGRFHVRNWSTVDATNDALPRMASDSKPNSAAAGVSIPPSERQQPHEEEKGDRSNAALARAYGVSPVEDVPASLASRPPLLPDRPRQLSSSAWVSNSGDGPVVHSPPSRADATRSGWHNWALTPQGGWKSPSPLGEHVAPHRRRKSLPQSMVQRHSSSFTNTNSTGNYSSNDSVGSWDFEHEESAPRPARSSSRPSGSSGGGRSMRKTLSTRSLPNRRKERPSQEASLSDHHHKQQRPRLSENAINMAGSLRGPFPDESSPTHGTPAWLGAPGPSPPRRESMRHRRTSSAAASPQAGSRGSPFDDYPGGGVTSEIRLARRLSGGAWGREHPQQSAGLPTSGRSLSGASSEAGPDSAVELLAGVVEMLREQVGTP